MEQIQQQHKKMRLDIKDLNNTVRVFKREIQELKRENKYLIDEHDKMKEHIRKIKMELQQRRR